MVKKSPSKTASATTTRKKATKSKTTARMGKAGKTAAAAAKTKTAARSAGAAKRGRFSPLAAQAKRGRGPARRAGKLHQISERQQAHAGAKPALVETGEQIPHNEFEQLVSFPTPTGAGRTAWNAIRLDCVKLMRTIAEQAPSGLATINAHAQRCLQQAIDHVQMAAFYARQGLAQA